MILQRFTKIRLWLKICSIKKEVEEEINLEEEEEFWTQTKRFSIEEFRSKDALKCNAEGCDLFSCVTYASSIDGSKRNCCLDC